MIINNIIYLSFLFLDDTIPDYFSTLIRLIDVSFMSNSLSSPFPTQLLQLTNLQYLAIQNNQIYGVF